MKLVACLCWYDEPIEGLEACIASLAGVADVLLAVDGAYAHYPTSNPVSAPEQHDAIWAAAEAAGLGLDLVSVDRAWQGDEVAKRAYMMERSVELAEGGWALVIDGDEVVEHAHPELLARLDAKEEDAAFVDYFWREHGTNAPLRRLFRALPGLTVRYRHFGYMIGDRLLWGKPGQEPTANATKLLALGHRVLRTDERQAARSRYYVTRDNLGLEA